MLTVIEIEHDADDAKTRDVSDTDAGRELARTVRDMRALGLSDREVELSLPDDYPAVNYAILSGPILRVAMVYDDAESG